MADFPLPKFNFSVQWGGESLAFMEVSGLTQEYEPLEYRDGLMRNSFSESRPGREKLGEVVCKRGLFHGDNDIGAWMETVLGPNNTELRDVTIALLDEAGNPKVVWKLANCWPLKWESTDLGADKNEIAIETLTFRHGGLIIEHA
jgi:phage tail-like protein